MFRNNIQNDNSNLQGHVDDTFRFKRKDVNNLSNKSHTLIKRKRKKENKDLTNIKFPLD